MVSKYGALHCHLLRINSTSYSEMPDPWSRVMEQRYRGLQRGLERARRAILEKTEVFQEVKILANFMEVFVFVKSDPTCILD